MPVLSPGLRRMVFRSLLVLLAGLGVGVAAFVLKKPSAAQSFDPAGWLEPARDRLDFGEVWEDSHFSWVLPITNHGDEDVEIERFRATCNCSRIEPKSLVIPAGQTRDIHLILDMLRKQPKGPIQPSRDFEVAISPDVPGGVDESQRIWWTIRGRVRVAIQCDTPVVDFGTESELAQPLSARKVTVKAFAALRNLKTVAPANFEVKINKHSAKGSDWFELLIAPRGSLPRGEIRCTITLVPELSDGKRVPAKKVEVVGRIVGDVEASPAHVLFGACPVGTKVEETITLRSLTRRPFTVTGARCEGAGLTVEQVPAASSIGPTFQVKQQIGGLGERSGKAIFVVRGEGGKEEEVVVPVSLCGIGAGAK